jgi:hypothetical protein
LISRLDGVGGTLVVRPDAASVGSLGNSGLDTLAEAEAEPLLTHPGASATRLRVGDVELVIEGWNPVPHLVIVEASSLSEALTRQAELLGWQATTTVTVEDTMRQPRRQCRSSAKILAVRSGRVAAPLRDTTGRIGPLLQRVCA